MSYRTFCFIACYSESGKVEINVEGCSYDKSVDNDAKHNHSQSNNNGCFLEVPQNDDGQLSSADELLTSTSVTYPSHSKSTHIPI